MAPIADNHDGTPTPPATPVIDVADLRMRYGSKDVLLGESFTVSSGEVVALLGPNGAGKTTTIEVLEGFRMRSDGHVSVLGVDPGHGDERWRARLGIVLQSWRDHGKWGVRELLSHIAAYYPPYATPARPRPRDVDELIATVGLSDHAGKKVKELSGGQRRRLDVAIGIVGSPEVLFLDEPTAGFDPEARQEFHEVVRRLAATEDTGILLTTHDLAEAEKLADRILILAGGRIVANGTSAELSRQVSIDAQVTWSVGGRLFTESTAQATKFVRELFDRYGDEVDDLEVRRASLEETYLAFVHAFETGSETDTSGLDLTSSGVTGAAGAERGR
ncbi:ABC transporter ATP-binding protein [Spelaeicoccus albus]|uniref:ABC-2 type transport system ATP-binding protein n=1 Tax=Spelaeicoccus albus TaxID=1280376 RepID=A0A7Z0AB16_9MICO|nr:ABC transporter ATP-binding protein [Spelaeicoccus albus]NYI66901.1 ABC-2 type transport system ATP-binding protein [Spelaeicoccus albus]